MFRRLIALAGLGSVLTLPAQAFAHPAPYAAEHVNMIYNMLFCDDPALFKGQNGREWFDADSNPAEVRRIAEDQNEESRVRALAYNWLRAHHESVPPGKVLGVIVELPVDEGLDVIAAYADGRVRYINHSGGMSLFEGVPPQIVAGAKVVLDSAENAGGLFKAVGQDRAAPTRNVRIFVLTSDGLYIAQGSSWDFSDPKLSRIENDAIQLMVLVVRTVIGD